MSYLAEIGSWISQNESLLSGLAAMIVVVGVVISILGFGYRRLMVGRSGGGSGSHASTPSAGIEHDWREPRTGSKDGDGGPAPPSPLTLKMLTAPSSHETKFATADGIRIAYNERGTGPPTIIRSPGIISHLNLMENLPATRGTLDCLSDFAHVVTFDKRGQGLSDPTVSAPDLEERTNDIMAVMDSAGVERAILMGISEGGPMCLQFASSHPERVQGLILVGTAARWAQSDDYPIGISRRALESMAQAWGKGVLRDIFFPSVSRQQMDDDTYRAFERLIGTPTSIKQIIEMMIETDVRHLLADIRVPALVVHFTGDLAVPIRLGRSLADGLPNAEFMEVNAVDHADLSQSPEAVDRIREFCNRVTADDRQR